MTNEQIVRQFIEHCRGVCVTPNADADGIVHNHVLPLMRRVIAIAEEELAQIDYQAKGLLGCSLESAQQIMGVKE